MFKVVRFEADQAVEKRGKRLLQRLQRNSRCVVKDLLPLTPPPSFSSAIDLSPIVPSQTTGTFKRIFKVSKLTPSSHDLKECLENEVQELENVFKLDVPELTSEVVQEETLKSFQNSSSSSQDHYLEAPSIEDVIKTCSRQSSIDNSLDDDTSKMYFDEDVSAQMSDGMHKFSLRGHLKSDALHKQSTSDDMPSTTSALNAVEVISNEFLLCTDLEQRSRDLDTRGGENRPRNGSNFGSSDMRQTRSRNSSALVTSRQLSENKNIHSPSYRRGISDEAMESPSRSARREGRRGDGRSSEGSMREVGGERRHSHSSRREKSECTTPSSLRNEGLLLESATLIDVRYFCQVGYQHKFLCNLVSITCKGLFHIDYSLV